MKDGSTAWTYHAGGSVKGGLAYDKGNLFFGDYSGNVTALRANDGSRVWSTGTNGRAFQQSPKREGEPGQRPEPEAGPAPLGVERAADQREHQPDEGLGRQERECTAHGQEPPSWSPARQAP